MGDGQKTRVATSTDTSDRQRGCFLPARTDIAGRFERCLVLLEHTNYGKTEQRTEEARLYEAYLGMKGKIEKQDNATKCRLLLMLNLSDHTDPSSIEALRRQVLVALLEDFADEKLVAKAIRTEHIRKEFVYTFALNTASGERAVIKLSERTCDILRGISATYITAHARLREFLDSAPDDHRAKFDFGTAQYIDHGKKRFAYRIQYEGRNAVLLIGIENAHKGSGAALLPIMSKEATLYAIAHEQKLRVLQLPEVFAVVGDLEDAGIVMTDITKGGNARVLCIQGNIRLIPPELLEEYERDMQKLGLVMSEHGIRAFEAIAEGSVYIQTSLKTGTVKIYALDFENLV